MNDVATTEISLRPLGQDVKPAAPAAATAQYAQGFEGAAAAPFPAEALKVLGAPVNPEEVETKPNGIVFLPGVAYRRILTRAFGAGAWALLPRSPARTMGNEVIYHGALYILGRFVSEAVGECASNGGGMSYASALEGARTDCLTRCCKDLGIATELWDAEWRGAWQAKFCTKEWREGRDGKKGSWHWLKIGNGGGEPTGRNVGAPRETATPAPSPIQEPEAPAPVDVGEAPTEAEVQAVRDAAKAVGWARPKASSWLKGLFGVATADGLTKDQASAALALLMAAKLDDNDAQYGTILTKLESEGRVLR